ncbi:MAG: replication protein [Bosea sp. 32-68-6]|nr:MAG: replication protein [Bosea sp. 32-68-6]
MARTEFAALSLQEKNTYLQGLAEEFCSKTGRPLEPLPKEALSRLRRYYSRRVFADLKLEQMPDDPLNQSLRSLGEAIRHEHLSADVTGALLASTPPKPVLRAPPQDDAQLMFFVPQIYDAPIKDDINLMDVAPFSISKSSKAGVLHYELKDSLVTVEGGAEVGLATVFDYDIFLHMVSYLAEEMRRFKADEAKGLRPSLPSKVYRPNSAHLLKFSRRSTGGRAYIDLEAALDRLAATRIKIVNLAGGRRRQVDSRPLIGEHRIVSRTATNRIDEVEITIPDWVWTSVVRSDKAPPILTLHPDYFLISSGIGRFIYRLSRKTAGKGQVRYTVRDLHQRSGSTQELRFFSRDLREFVQRTKIFPLPEYDLDIEQGREADVLCISYRDTPPKGAAFIAPPAPLDI